MRCSPTILIPIVVLAVLIWSFYTYIDSLCFNLVKGTIKRLIFIAIETFFFLMLMFSFMLVVVIPNETLPEEYKLSEEDHAKYMLKDNNGREEMLQQVCMQRQLTVRNCSKNGHLRYCLICRGIKPDRAHHCSACRTCILRMDHHCDWISNCVGFSNYKQFILLLTYGSFYCIFYFFTCLDYFIYDRSEMYKYIQLLIGAGVSVAFQVFTSGLLLYHITLMRKNETTIERILGNEHMFINRNLSYNLGCVNNFRQFLGENVLLWLVPTRVKIGNGFVYPVKVMMTENG